jgi:hypothetical protein
MVRHADSGFIMKLLDRPTLGLRERLQIVDAIDPDCQIDILALVPDRDARTAIVEKSGHFAREGRRDRTRR